MSAKAAKGAQETWPKRKKASATTDESYAQTKPAKAAKTTEEAIDSEQSHQAPLDAEGWLDNENRHLDRSVSLRDLAKFKLKEPKYLIEGLVRCSSAVVVRADPAVEYAQYLLTLGIAAGAGQYMRPYGWIDPLKVCFLYMGAIPETDFEFAQLVRGNLNSQEKRELADDNVEMVCMADFQTRRRSLAIGSDQQRLIDLVPSDAELVIILDANLPTPKGVNDNDLRSLDWMLRELTERGTSVLVCGNAERRSWESVRRTIRASCPLSFVEFEYDRAAPSDHGKGFIIRRQRLSIHESGPLAYRVWNVKEGRKLTFGFGLIDPDDTQSARATRAAEFKKMCMVLEAQEIPRNQIAESLGVHKSTVTRALGATRGKKKPDSSDDTNTSTEAEE